MTTVKHHVYRYTLGLRTVTTVSVLDKNGKDTGTTERVTTWPLQEVVASDIHEAARFLHYKLDDVRFEGKEIIK